MPDNPFAATEVGEVYARWRPYHHPRSLAHIRALVGDAPVTHAVDLACGTGMSTLALTEHADAVVGVDISASMVAAAPKVARASYAFARAERLPFADRSIDAVTCCSGIHWFDQEQCFAELARVLRRDGWIGLYDHYFSGEMRDVPEFGRWTADTMARFPLPPRYNQVGDPRWEMPAGFVKVGDESFVDDIEMTIDAFADYQLSISNFVAAAERGEPRAEMRAWLLQTLTPLYSGVETRTVQFLGSITCLRLDSA